MIMMIAPSSLACQKEGEEEAGDQRKGVKLGTSASGTDVPTGISLSVALNVRNRRKHGRWYGVSLHRKGRGGLGISPILSR